MIDLVEESLEIIGVSLFLYTLLEHLSALARAALPVPDPEVGGEDQP